MDRPTHPIGSRAPDAPRVPEVVPPEGAADSLPEPVLVEPRQRWRLTFAREPVAPEDVGRAAFDAWTDALRASGLPVSGFESGGTGRARLGFGAPLPAACWGDAELVDVWLLERVPAWRVREGLEGRMPAAHRWVDAEDVWLGAPALAGQVVAADWRVALTGAVPAQAALGAAAARLLAAPELPRTRSKGGVDRPYDLRPLLVDVRVETAEDSGAILRITTRIDPAVGAGRPEEVVLALAEATGATFSPRSITRERLVLADPRADPSVRTRGGPNGPRRPSRR